MLTERCSTFSRLATGLVLCAVLLGASSAQAGLSVAASLGGGMKFDPLERTPVNLEVTPSYGVSIVKFDFGVLFHLEGAVRLLVRPGVRVNILVLYARGALPLKVTGDFDWGFLVGLGGNLVNLGPVKLFAEANASFFQEHDFKEFPVEARLGLELGF